MACKAVKEFTFNYNLLDMNEVDHADAQFKSKLQYYGYTVNHTVPELW